MREDGKEGKEIGKIDGREQINERGRKRRAEESEAE